MSPVEATADGPTRTVESEGVRLAVFERGDPANPTVLLVHGYPDTHTVWDDVARLLASRFHVVAYDVRGAGASTAPRGIDGYRLPLLAADLRAVADAVSPDAPVHVVAHDWGSIQSWEAVTEPGAEHRIASYTSISGPCLDHVGQLIRQRLSHPTPANLRQVLSQQLHSWYIVAFQVPALAPLVWRLWLARRWGAVLERVEGVPRRAGHPAPTLAADAVRGISLYRANMLPRLRSPRRRGTEVPVQVIQPTGDHYVTPGLTDGLDRWVSRLWVRSVPARHWAPLTHAPVVARMVTELVDHVGGAPEPRSLRRAWVRRFDTVSKPFADQLVVVTGGGSGIGRATALAFAERGAEVVICDVDDEGAQRTAELARLIGPGGSAYHVDVADESAVRGFADRVAAVHGVPDIVVNNAGIGHAGSFLNTSHKDWERVLDVNLWGVIHGCQAFGELLVARGEGGHIVNVASAAAYLPSRLLPAYSTSKAAVFMLSDCLRAELVDADIGVSTICPGLINTNITRTSTHSGVDDVEQDRRRSRSTELYRRRGFPAKAVAKEIVRAVRRDIPVLPVTVEAKATRLLGRISPAALRAAARISPM
ncbi:MAG TPA: SDR family oxidoreductase [Pseudonocardiaceae bacterium]|nr:SDR family oxidoreductase [Pseudonocardiaceae bacterium]